MAKPRVDWEAVERDYRVDRFTNVELCDKHDLDPATLSRRIKRDRERNPASWQKDLREAVREATNARLINEMVKAEVNGQVIRQEIGQEARQEQIKAVDAVAAVNVSIILAHRDRARMASEVTLGILSELQAAAALVEHREILEEIMVGEGAKPEDVVKARQAIERALSIGSRASTVKSLTEALAKQIEIERKAYRLDAEEEKPKEPAEQMPLEEAARRLAYLFRAGQLARKAANDGAAPIPASNPRQAVS